MANITYSEYGEDKDVWHVIHSGDKAALFTLMQFRNRSGHSVLLGVAIGDMEDGDTAVDSDGDLVLDNVDVVVTEDTVSSGESYYFNTDQGGTLFLEEGKKLAYTLSGDGDLHALISGREL